MRHIALTAPLLVSTAAIAESTCFGTTSKGRIDTAVSLPNSGNNFSAYSTAGVALGRTYVHSKVAEIVTSAYRELERTTPQTRFVYGETGWKTGGTFNPHRTHQNGLSVDFFVPVKNSNGNSVPFPGNVTNKFGYDVEFDANGRYREYSIDFAALGEHLYQLQIAAARSGVPIKLVIFEPAYLPKLFATKHGDFLKSKLNFMKRKAWVRHDEHYHVDFDIPCKPLK